MYLQLCIATKSYQLQYPYCSCVTASKASKNLLKKIDSIVVHSLDDSAKFKLVNFYYSNILHSPLISYRDTGTR